MDKSKGQFDKWLRHSGTIGTAIANLLAFLTTNWGLVVSAGVGVVAAVSQWATAFVLRPSTEVFIIVFLTLLWTYIGLTVLVDRKKPRQVRAAQDYAYGLTFEGVVPIYQPTEDDAAFGIGLSLRNYSSGPIHYDVESLDLRIGTRSLPKLKQGVLFGYMPRGGARTSTPAPFKKSDIVEFVGKRSTGTLEFSISYGHPERPPVRRLRMTFDLHIALNEQNLSFGAAITSETDEPINNG